MIVWSSTNKTWTTVNQRAVYTQLSRTCLEALLRLQENLTPPLTPPKKKLLLSTPGLQDIKTVFLLHVDWKPCSS